MPLRLRRLALGTTAPARAPTDGPIVSMVRDPHLARWIRCELSSIELSCTRVHSIEELTAHGASHAAPPRIVLVAIDDLEAGELCALRRLREAGFSGTLVALSRARLQATLRAALGIDVLVTAPFVQDLLADLFRDEEAQSAG